MVTILGMDQYPEPCGFDAHDVTVRLDHAPRAAPRFVIELPEHDIVLTRNAADKLVAHISVLGDAL